MDSHIYELCYERVWVRIVNLLTAIRRKESWPSWQSQKRKILLLSSRASTIVPTVESLRMVTKKAFGETRSGRTKRDPHTLQLLHGSTPACWNVFVSFLEDTRLLILTMENAPKNMQKSNFAPIQQHRLIWFLMWILPIKAKVQSCGGSKSRFYTGQLLCRESNRPYKLFSLAY